MARLTITTQPNGGRRLTIDGIDLTEHVAGVDLSVWPDGTTAAVHLAPGRDTELDLDNVDVTIVHPAAPVADWLRSVDRDALRRSALASGFSRDPIDCAVDALIAAAEAQR